METPKYKYPRSWHLPWSLGTTSDDVRLDNCDHFVGKRVIVTEKVDGESASLYRDTTHARSLDSRHHPSRNWVKSLQGQIGWKIPENWRVCGENAYAEHSIFYEKLPSYFLAFSIWDETNTALSWDETVMWCEELEIAHVPVLYDGIWDEEQIKELWPLTSRLGAEMPEGYVVRIADSFHYDRFALSLAKMVRKNHVQTDEHWMNKQIVPNKIG